MQSPLLRSFVLLSCILFPLSLSAQLLDDEWDDRFDLPGVQGRISNSAVDGEGNLYVLGDILGANGLESGGTLLKWDGVRWSSPGLSGDSLLVNGAWYRIENTAPPMITAGTTLYLVAHRINYNESDREPVHVLALEGEEWRTVGEEFDDIITTLAAHGSTLYAAGSFSTVGGSHITGLARWNGTVWENVGGGINGDVSTMTVDRYGTLYITGSFTQTGNTQAEGGGMWNGAEWKNFGEQEMNGSIARSATSGVMLYGLARNSLYRLEGADWKKISNAVETDYAIEPYTLAVDSIGSIYVTATRRNRPWIAPFSLLRFNNDTWSKVSAEFDGSVRTATFGSGERMFAGGTFLKVNDTTIANGIVAWDGIEWRSLSFDESGEEGLTGNVAAVEIAGGYFYAAGTELQSANLPRSHAILRRRAEGRWETVGGGVNGSVRGLLNNPAGGLYVAGCFDRAGNVAASNIAWWDGADWHPLGEGPGFCVADMAAANGALYAVGEQHLARWDGTEWTRLADDIEGEALAVAAAANGTVYVGGRFDVAGGVMANNIAAWRDGRWSPLENGIRLYNSSNTIPGAEFAEIQTLALDAEYLYAGGTFDSAGSAEAYNIARWDGTNWSGMYAGLTGGTWLPILWEFNPTVRDIKVTADHVFVGGHFHGAGKWWKPSDTTSYVISAGIAFWDKKLERWNSVGSGVATQTGRAPTVHSVAVRGDSLWIGGDFTMAAKRSSYNVARMKRIPAPVVRQPVAVTEIDFGAVHIGSYVDTVLTISNPATSTRTLSGTAEVVEGPFAITSRSSFGVVPGVTLTLPIRFTATAPGFAAGKAIVRYNATDAPQELTISLWGNGLPPVIACDVRPTGIDFGSWIQQESALHKDVRVTNLSQSTQSFSVTASPLPIPFSISLPERPEENPFGNFTLLPNQSITYRITADLRTAGNYRAAFVLQHDAAPEKRTTIPVQLHVAEPSAVMTVLPNLPDFGNVQIGQKQNLSLTIANDPGSNVPITFMSAEAEMPFSIEHGNDQTMLEPGKEKTLTISFAPSAAGRFKSVIAINRTIDGIETTLHVPVQGSGAEGIISPVISPTEINFGSIGVGRNKQIMMTISNQADATLPLHVEYGALQSPLSVAEPGTHTLQPGTVRTYSVHFTPTGIGIYRDTIVVNHNAPGLPNPFVIPVYGESTLSAVAEDDGTSGSTMTLRARPNPAGGATSISFRATGNDVVTLTIHSLDGREVARLIDSPVEPGEHTIEWDTQGKGSGVYLCRLKQGTHTATYTVVVSR